MSNRNRGKFYVVAKHVKDGSVFGLLKALMFVPYRVEMRYDIGAFEYIGSSPAFDEVDRGIMTPKYIITYDGHRVVSIARANDVETSTCSIQNG